MIAQAPGVTAASTTSPLEAFSGTITRTKTGPLYTAGLAVVAFAMVLLPLIYVALIVLTAWGVYLHLKYDAWIVAGGSSGWLFRLIFYLGPAVAGGILIFFMVKPFFAKRAKSADPITLDPTQEPLLFAFVGKICALVGAPTPRRIDVDCQVNASASLRRGLWSRDLVLTIGLPLASGVDMRQFAGVLAHEFGHFAQGAGMRLTYIIRNISFWFARVVYERDKWDVQLEESARTADWRLSIVLQLARGCVWVSRRILWVLMHAGNAISCFMLRQMEYDADSYEAKVAGSEAFELTAHRLQTLNVATQAAYEEVRQNWASRRLPGNLPLLIGYKASVMPEEVRQKLSSSSAAAKTGWFDTHPCDADRIRAARRLNQPGVFLLPDPAERLFSNFAELSETVTRHQYEHGFGLEFKEENLMPSEEILRESAANAEAEAMVKKFYGRVDISAHPLLTAAELPPISDHDAVVAEWERAKESSEALREEAEKMSAERQELQGRLVNLISAQHLAKARFKLEPQEFGLPLDAVLPEDQQEAASKAIAETNEAIADRRRRIEPFMEALRGRVMLALRLAMADGATPPGAQASEIAALARVLAGVGAEMAPVQEIGSRLRAFSLLGQNLENNPSPIRVQEVMLALAGELRPVIDGIQTRLSNHVYPFTHARGHLSVADYARWEKPAETEILGAYLNAGAHVDRLFTLNYRLLGRVLAQADAAERALERS